MTSAYRVCRTAAALGVVLLGAVGCGVPSGGRPHAISRSAVPFGLLDPAPASASAQPNGPALPVYLLHNDHLVAVTRHLNWVNRPAELVRVLFEGPTADESSRGLTTDIPSGTVLLSLDVNGTTATADLSKAFGDLGGSEQVLAVAQVVYTLTASRHIDGVRFTVEGRTVEVPDGSGSLSSRPRTRSDFPGVLAAAR